MFLPEAGWKMVEIFWGAFYEERELFADGAADFPASETHGDYSWYRISPSPSVVLREAKMN